jgi:hypothetical protein
MKTKYLKAAGAAVSLLIASGPALATSTGPQTLGAFAEATDVFQFTCPAGTVTVKWIISDTTVIVNVPARIRMGMTKVGQIHWVFGNYRGIPQYLVLSVCEGFITSQV